MLYDQHAPWLVLRLTRRCGDPDLVDEIVQETFLQVWRKAHTYRGTGAVGAWIWRIGLHRLLDRFRRRSPVMVEFDEQRGDRVASAEEAVLSGIEHGQLGPALDRLSPELQAVVRATVLDGLTSREAGRLLGVPAVTVRSRLLRARRQLREDLA